LSSNKNIYNLFPTETRRPEPCWNRWKLESDGHCVSSQGAADWDLCRRTRVSVLTPRRAVSFQARTLAPKPRRMTPVSALNVFISMPLLVNEGPGFQGGEPKKCTFRKSDNADHEK